jgi:hypothetical protein
VENYHSNFSLPNFIYSTFFSSKESGEKETAAPARAGANSFRGLAKITKRQAPKRY